MRLSGDVTFGDRHVMARCKGKIIFGDEVDQIVRMVARGEPRTRFVVVDVANVVGLSGGDLGGLWLRYMKARALGWRIAFVRLAPELSTLLSDLSIEHAFEIYPDESSALLAFFPQVKRVAA